LEIAAVALNKTNLLKFLYIAWLFFLAIFVPFSFKFLQDEIIILYPQNSQYIKVIVMIFLAFATVYLVMKPMAKIFWKKTIPEKDNKEDFG
jgi:hypothetical protein